MAKKKLKTYFFWFLFSCSFQKCITLASNKKIARIYISDRTIKSPTCFKNLINPSCIHLILTNKCKNFQGYSIVETGLSDHHKMVITVMQSYFPKQQPKVIEYRDYKNFNTLKLQMELKKRLDSMDKMATYELFEEIFQNIWINPP